jgi:RNA polymerase sigma-70 factor (ECF subfamily)
MAVPYAASHTPTMFVLGSLAHHPGLSARFAAVYETHVDFVWRNVRRLGVPDGAADDVVQSVFLVVFRRLDDFEGRSSLKTWIYEIVLRVVRDHRRTVRRKSPHAADADPIDPTTLIGPAEQRPDALADRAETARIVQELLDGLSDEKREVFVLAELEGLTLHEISQILHEPPGTIATRLRRARAEFERAAARWRACEQRRPGWTG